MQPWLLVLVAAFGSIPACAADSDPSRADVKALIDRMKTDGASIPAASPSAGTPAPLACPDCSVLPVVLVASDLSEAAASDGVAKFVTALKFVQAWYLSQTGKTFAILPAETAASNLTAGRWIALSCLTATPDERTHNPPCDQRHFNNGRPQSRYGYYQEVEQEFKAKHPGNDDQKRRFIIAVFAGDQPNVWLGAADGQAYAVAAPRSTSVSCPAFKDDPSGADPLCRDSVYGIAHELGHSFGLIHSCEQNLYPKVGCENSFMQAKHPPGMVMLDGERELLLKNEFIHLTTLDENPRRTTIPASSRTEFGL